ncbi:MAG: ATP-dependent DNA helicase RecG [Candidatus Omnitrophica bacterium]|nr:ATP-dependent DNA helicase RecG [Candidatus Omnitrophota bacterium]
MKSLFDSIRYLKGIGPKRARIFQAAGISTVEDLLYFFPRRYLDWRNILSISQLKENTLATIKARILSIKFRQSWRYRGPSILELEVADESGKMGMVWFNQSYLKNYFKAGQEVIFCGKTRRYGLFLQMVAPEFEIILKNEELLESAGRITPVYPQIEGVSQRYLRRLIQRVLKEYLPYVKDVLPFDIRQRQNLLNLAKSLREIHFPENLDLQKEAYRRLCFEEFFLFIIPVALRKLRLRQRLIRRQVPEGKLLEKFIAGLPFSLTSAQKKVIAEIKEDMTKPFSMQRLLQGDVGSGKTVVAICAAILSIESGFQVAVLVPTEILARQHYEKISREFLTSQQLQKEIKMGLLTSGTKEKTKIIQEISEGKINLVIGTHALLEEVVQFKNLGLVVIDEQHKFGVAQRSLLPQKGNNPDSLIMTATPIPRTLAITLYGDLDISVIDELPPARKPVITRWVREKERFEVYKFIREKVREGRQVYIVYPIIKESCVLDLRAAEQMYKELKREVFGDLRLGLVHGQMRQELQDKTMKEFKEGKIDILVSTTVLEVGIDVSNATVMVIEHAERFGLSQLHQLRGRIGRGSQESHCILISEPQTEEAKARIKIMSETSDGFRIAEEDLRIRGPGEFFGDRQHGLSELKIANPLTQMQLLRIARNEAIKLIRLDPQLLMRQNQGIKETLKKKFPGYEELQVVG